MIGFLPRSPWVDALSFTFTFHAEHSGKSICSLNISYAKPKPMYSLGGIRAEMHAVTCHLAPNSVLVSFILLLRSSRDILLPGDIFISFFFLFPFFFTLFSKFSMCFMWGTVNWVFFSKVTKITRSPLGQIFLCA